MATNIDALVLDEFLLLKDQQRGEKPNLEAYLGKYGND
jgi:hypothetical protein